MMTCRWRTATKALLLKFWSSYLCVICVIYITYSLFKERTCTFIYWYIYIFYSTFKALLWPYYDYEMNRATNDFIYFSSLCLRFFFLIFILVYFLVFNLARCRLLDGKCCKNQRYRIANRNSVSHKITRWSFCKIKNIFTNLFVEVI